MQGIDDSLECTPRYALLLRYGYWSFEVQRECRLNYAKMYRGAVNRKAEYIYRYYLHLQPSRCIKYVSSFCILRPQSPDLPVGIDIGL